MNHSTEQENKWADELRHYRTIMKMEMQRVINCDTAQQKRDLVTMWKSAYSQIFCKELINMAKDKIARAKAANWDIDNFDRKITK